MMREHRQHRSLGTSPVLARVLILLQRRPWRRPDALVGGEGRTMANHDAAPPRGQRHLRFACACASALSGPDDPWVAVARDGKLSDGTKELVLNATYRQPRTIT